MSDHFGGHAWDVTVPTPKPEPEPNWRSLYEAEKKLCMAMAKSINTYGDQQYLLRRLCRYRGTVDTGDVLDILDGKVTSVG